jgi:hypothetical protein
MEPEHRLSAFGAGFVANRAIVAVFLTLVFVATLAIADRMLAAGWSSQMDVAIAVASALAAGALFQANYRRYVRIVDRLFLPRRYAASVALDRIAASVRRRESHTAERIAVDVAEALGLASVAIFARTADDGFVRRAAYGWPAESAWHLLPGEALTRALDGRARLVSLAGESDFDGALPSGTARPCVAVTLRRRGRVRSAILLGPDRNGGRPDIDTVRGLAAILREVVAG